MALVGTVDLIALLATAAALGWLAAGWRRGLPRDAKLLMAGLLALGLFRHCSNMLEWLQVTAALDIVEDHLEVLAPILWGFFFYACVQHMGRRELAESEERNRALLASLPQRVFFKDPDSVFVSVNEPFARDLGIEPQDVVGRTDFDLYPADLARKYRDDDRRVMASRRAETLIERNVSGRSERTVEVVKAPVVDDGQELIGLLGVFTDITERTAAEQALQESESKFRNLAEHSPNMIFINQGGRVVYANRKCEEVLGYLREEFYASDFDYLVLVEPGCHDLIRENFARHGRGEEIEPYEYVLLTKDGERVDALIATKLIPYGGERAILGIVTDITERKRAEQALRESEERFRLLAETAFDGISMCSYDPQTGRRVPIFCNDRFVEMAGRSREQLLQCRDLSDLMVLHGEPGKTRELRERLNSGLPATGTASWKRPDGKENVFEWSAVRVKVGRDHRVFGVDRDITERRRAEEALRASAAQYRTTLECMGDAIHVVDPELRVLLCNSTLRSWAEELGLSTEIIGRPLPDVFPFVPEHVWEEYRQVFATGQMKRTEEAVQVAGRRIVTESRKIPVVEGGRVGRVVTVLRDVTESQRAEKALRESERRYRELWDDAPVAYHVVDPQGVIQRVNKTELTMLGYEAEQMLGRPIFDFIAPEERAEARQRFRMKVAGEDVGPARVRHYVSKGGVRLPVSIEDVLEYDDAGRLTGVRTTMVDIAEQVRLQEQLQALSLEDELTGLKNRRGFTHLASQQLRVARRAGTQMLLLFADLDNMKWINDTFGHKEGDLALMEAAEVLEQTFRESDIVARVGGDEFAVLAIDAAGPSAVEIRRRLQGALDARNAQEGRRYELSLSVGIVRYDPQEPAPLDELMEAADRRMYEDKRAHHRPPPQAE